MKKSIVKIRGVCILVAILLLFSGCCSHEWSNATCAVPQTCTLCGKAKGEPTNDHAWEDATCENPQTCSVCGMTQGEVGEHKWEDATCLAPETCELCSETKGEALEHDYKEATYDMSAVCRRCGVTFGRPLTRGLEMGFYKLSEMGNALIDIRGYRINSSSGYVVVITNKDSKASFMYFYNGNIFWCNYEVVDGVCNIDLTLNNHMRSYSVISNDYMILDNGWSELGIEERKLAEEQHKGFVVLVLDNGDWCVPYSLIDWERGAELYPDYDSLTDYEKEMECKAYKLYLKY